MRSLRGRRTGHSSIATPDEMTASAIDRSAAEDRAIACGAAFARKPPGPWNTGSSKVKLVNGPSTSSAMIRAASHRDANFRSFIASSLARPQMNTGEFWREGRSLERRLRRTAAGGNRATARDDGRAYICLKRCRKFRLTGSTSGRPFK